METPEIETNYDNYSSDDSDDENLMKWEPQTEKDTDNYRKEPAILYERQNIDEIHIATHTIRLNA